MKRALTPNCKQALCHDVVLDFLNKKYGTAAFRGQSVRDRVDASNLDVKDYSDAIVQAASGKGQIVEA